MVPRKVGIWVVILTTAIAPLVKFFMGGVEGRTFGSLLGLIAAILVLKLWWDTSQKKSGQERVAEMRTNMYLIGFMVLMFVIRFFV